jgi:hypothetical protein
VVRVDNSSVATEGCHTYRQQGRLEPSGVRAGSRPTRSILGPWRPEREEDGRQPTADSRSEVPCAGLRMQEPGDRDASEMQVRGWSQRRPADGVAGPDQFRRSAQPLFIAAEASYEAQRHPLKQSCLLLSGNAHTWPQRWDKS